MSTSPCPHGPAGPVRCQASSPRHWRSAIKTRSSVKVPFKSTLVLVGALSATLLLSACGQTGPLRHPWETAAQAREHANQRRLPTGTRSDLPTVVDDASSTQTRP